MRIAVRVLVGVVVGLVVLFIVIMTVTRPFQLPEPSLPPPADVERAARDGDLEALRAGLPLSEDHLNDLLPLVLGNGDIAMAELLLGEGAEIRLDVFEWLVLNYDEEEGERVDQFGLWLTELGFDPCRDTRPQSVFQGSIPEYAVHEYEAGPDYVSAAYVEWLVSYCQTSS